MYRTKVDKGLVALLGLIVLAGCSSSGTDVRVTNDCGEDLQFGVYDARVEWETQVGSEIRSGESGVLSVNGDDVVSINLVASRTVESADSISTDSVSNEVAMADLSTGSDGALAITASGDMCLGSGSAG